MSARSPLTPRGLALQYVMDLANLDPWTPIAKVVEQAFVAGYLANEARSQSSVGEPLPPAVPISAFSTPDARLTAVTGSILPESTLLPLVHRNGASPCHKPAMFVTRLLQYGEPANLGLLRLMPDMREPTPLDAPTCGSCGQPVDPYTQRDLDWRPVFDQSLPPVSRQSRPPAQEPSQPQSDPDSAVSLAAEGIPTEGVRPDAVEAYPSAPSPEPVTSPDRVRGSRDVEQDIENLQALAESLRPAP